MNEYPEIDDPILREVAIKMYSEPDPLLDEIAKNFCDNQLKDLNE